MYEYIIMYIYICVYMYVCENLRSRGGRCQSGPKRDNGNTRFALPLGIFQYIYTHMKLYMCIDIGI